MEHVFHVGSEVCGLLVSETVEVSGHSLIDFCVTRRCLVSGTSYSDQTTFGFFVDVGNGFSTILPSIHLLLSMTFNLSAPFGLSPRSAGLLNILFFWQEFYGTAIYLLSYFVNQRYKGHKTWHVWVVIIANGIWFVGPAVGMWCCARLVHENRWDVVRA